MKKIFLALLCCLTLTNIFSTPLRAQNSIYFPYVVNDSATLTELVFTNATGLDATIKLSAYRQDGTYAAIAQSPLSVPANSQAIFCSCSLSDFRGWVLADSNVAGVTGNLRLSSPDHTALEITEPTQPATTFVLPFVAQGSGMSTEISVVNPTRNFGRVDLTVYNRDGSVQASTFRVLPPYGMVSGSLGSIFPGGTQFDNASHALARSTPMNIFSPVVNIIGFEVVRGFQSVAQNIYARTDVGALTGIPLPAGGSQSLVFPHVTRGSNWSSLIGLVNLSNSSQSASLYYVDDSGHLISSTNNPANVSIPANGSARWTATELFGSSNDSGSVQITSNGNLIGFLGIGSTAGSSFATSSGQAQAQTQFLLPAVDETGESFTAIILLNPNDSVTSVILSLISPAGVTLGTHHLNLQPRHRSVNRIKDLFLEGLNQTGGYIFVSSSAPIFAQGYLGIPDKILSALLSQVTASEFAPPPQLSYVIRGIITDTAGAPLVDVTLTLAKGANQLSTTTTDANGEYLFRDLSSGIYTVTPTLAGKMFNPQSSTITLATASNGAANFTAIAPGLPVITSVSPTETMARYEVNSPGLTITVKGFGFTPSTRILFDDRTGLNGVEIFTTYVSSTQLTAFLPAQALSSGGIYLIRARNAGFVSGEAVNFTINNLVPQITSLDPPGPIKLGPGPGPIQLNLAVNGSNFHAPGGKDPGTLIGISITPDSFPAINPLIGSTPQCTLVNTRFPFPIGVRAFDLGGNPAAGVSVTFTAPALVTDPPTPSGSFSGGDDSVTVVTDAQGYAYAPVFSANPFPGVYAVIAKATISGIPLTTLFALTNLNPGDTCSALSSISYVSSQQVIVSVPVSQTGTYTIQAVNFSPGGGRSELTEVSSFVVQAGNPTGVIPIIISLSPSSVKAGSSSFTLTVGGINFRSNSWINFGTVRLATEVLDENTLRAIVPDSLVTSPGIVPITATNPGDTGGTSRRVEFLVNP